MKKKYKTGLPLLVCATVGILTLILWLLPFSTGERYIESKTITETKYDYYYRHEYTSETTEHFRPYKYDGQFFYNGYHAMALFDHDVCGIFTSVLQIVIAMCVVVMILIGVLYILKIFGAPFDIGDRKSIIFAKILIILYALLNISITVGILAGDYWQTVRKVQYCYETDISIGQILLIIVSVLAVIIVFSPLGKSLNNKLQFKTEMGKNVYICSSCGNKAKSTEKFCASCGGMVERKIFTQIYYLCSKCGKKANSDEKFCSECGGEIVKAEQSSDF